MFKSLDLYGENVTLHFKGQEKYTTLLGAVVSLFILILIISYSFQQAFRFYQRAGPAMATLSFARDLNTDPGFDPFESGFDFALNLRGDWI